MLMEQVQVENGGGDRFTQLYEVNGISVVVVVAKRENLFQVLNSFLFVVDTHPFSSRHTGEHVLACIPLRALPLGTGRFCWSKVLLHACPSTFCIDSSNFSVSQILPVFYNK